MRSPPQFAVFAEANHQAFEIVRSLGLLPLIASGEPAGDVHRLISWEAFLERRSESDLDKAWVIELPENLEAWPRVLSYLYDSGTQIWFKAAVTWDPSVCPDRARDRVLVEGDSWHAVEASSLDPLDEFSARAEQPERSAWLSVLYVADQPITADLLLQKLQQTRLPLSICDVHVAKPATGRRLLHMNHLASKAAGEQLLFIDGEKGLQELAGQDFVSRARAKSVSAGESHLLAYRPFFQKHYGFRVTAGSVTQAFCELSKLS